MFVLFHFPIGLAQNQAEDVLMEVITHGIKMKDFHADFRYESQSANRRNQKKRGELIYMDHKYVILLEDLEIYIVRQFTSYKKRLLFNPHFLYLVRFRTWLDFSNHEREGIL